jgi:hypothetical protein
MTEKVGRRDPALDQMFSPFVELPEKRTQPAKPQASGRPLGDRAAIDQAIFDKSDGQHGVNARRARSALVDKFTQRQALPRPTCRSSEKQFVDVGADSRMSIARRDEIQKQFAELESKHEKVVGTLEKRAREWDKAAAQIARTESNPVLRKEKVEMAQGAARYIRNTIRDLRIEFGVIKHPYMVALGLSKEAAWAPALPRDKQMSMSELKARTRSFDQRIDTVRSSGLIAPVAAFLYVALTEASGRSIDRRDRETLDKFYAIGKAGEGFLEAAAPGTDPDRQHAEDLGRISQRDRFGTMRAPR